MASRLILTRVVVFGALSLVPFFWNACGKVSFAEKASDSGGGILSCTDPTLCGGGPGGPGDPGGPGTPPVVTLKTESIDVKENKDVDILFVVDNSGSMDQEQKDIGQKIGGFLDKVKDLNWQIAITTTDANTNTPAADGTSRPWGDGQFRPFDGDTGTNYILKPSQSSVPGDLQSMLSAAVNVGIKGSGDERGIYGAYRAIERSAAAGVNKDFIRPDARLAVVVISDEDECSTGAEKCGGADKDKDKPENIVSLVKNQLGTNKVFSFNSIIYIPGDNTCTTGQSEGATYHALTQMTGGQEGSVCANDFSAPLGKIGEKVQDLVKSVALSCAPVDVNQDGVPDLAIKRADGSVMKSGFTVNAMTVTLDSPLPAGSYQFVYYCK